MRDIITKSIKELNDILPKEKKLDIKSSTLLVDEKSKLESIDLVNLFVNLEGVKHTENPYAICI